MNSKRIISIIIVVLLSLFVFSIIRDSLSRKSILKKEALINKAMNRDYSPKKDKEANCKIPFEVKNFTSSNEVIKICDETFYKGETKIVSKNDYPDLFEFTLDKQSKPEAVEQYVRVFEKDGQEYVSIKSFIDYNSWFKNSIGIYRKENNKYVLVFKKSFSDNSGRWVNIEFGEDTMNIDPYLSVNYRGEGLAISGDIGYLGCLGGCRLLWWDFYEWNSAQKTYVLANNKNSDYFKKLLVDYEDFNKTYCLKNANVSKNISSLYLIRKDKEKICSDNAIEPAATVKQAEKLLKGIKAIKLIINGENIPMSEVSKLNID